MGVYVHNMQAIAYHYIMLTKNGALGRVHSNMQWLSKTMLTSYIYKATTISV